MQNDQIKRNPTRFNKTISRGENEKSNDEKDTSTGNFERSDSGSGGKTSVVSGRRADSDSDEEVQFQGGPEAGDYDGPDVIKLDESGTPLQ